MTKQSTRISPKQFAKVWMEAYENFHTQQWVADKLKMKRSAVTMRKIRYKERGLNLPELHNRSLSELNDELGIE